MFTLHERTRLLLCRSGFLILCVLPTFFVAAAAVHYRSTDYLEARREEWAGVLSDKLGLEVQIGRLSYPHWNVALLEDVTLLDPETSNQVLRSGYVEVELNGGRWHVSAGQPEVNGAALPLLAELVNYRLLRGQGVKLAPLDVEVGAITVRNGDAAQTFQQVVMELVTTETGKQATVKFRIAGVESLNPLEFTITRDRSDAGPTTTCVFNTSDSSLPCGTLAPLWPWLEQLGDEAMFSGKVTLDQSSTENIAKVVGRFENVELDQLVSQRFPHHRLTGRAEVIFDPLELHGGTIANMRGTLQTVGGGIVSRSLLEAFATRLGLAPDQPLRLQNERIVKYTHLAFGFQLDQQGLSLSGAADPVREGVIMAGARSNHLLMEPTEPVIAPANFIRALSPQSDVQVPATREAKSLFDLLPLPSLVPVDESVLPSATMRLREDK